MKFKLKAPFKPTGDQPKAIETLIEGVNRKEKDQVLVGVTGSGKTFTMANIIEKTQMPTLIISHNKTLAGQLYQEMREFFPNNAVSYFVSYYDYYQPEAYIPQTDTYIEKEAQINQTIDKLRLQSTTNILTRKDAIVVASVSCIYNIGSPKKYGNFVINLKVGMETNFQALSLDLARLQYEQSKFDFQRGTFRIRGRRLDVYPAYEDMGIRIEIEGAKISKIERFDPVTNRAEKTVESISIYPAKHYLIDKPIFDRAEKRIRRDLKKEVDELRKRNKIAEADRLLRRTNFDLEMIKEVGYVSGIENYSRYFDNRQPGDPPYTLLNYFKEAYGNNWLTFIDESHMTVPQIRGMFNGDHARKQTLIEFGFRLQAAYDNRPLRFEEFYRLAPHFIYTSATPSDWEVGKAKTVAEQLVRPTGIIDPEIIIRPAEGEIDDLIAEVEKRAKRKEKVLVTTLTKQIAEDLTDYLKEKDIRVNYLHSDIKTLERSTLLDSLRKGEYDALIGVNLLREGLDLPEVTLVAILDGDKEGFLRSKTALIQTMGRTARNVKGQVIIYADRITKSIKGAQEEIERRRRYQQAYNQKHHLKPKTIYKPLRERIVTETADFILSDRKKDYSQINLLEKIRAEDLTPYDRQKIIKKLRRAMKKQADEFNFELAIKLRDKIRQLQK